MAIVARSDRAGCGQGGRFSPHPNPLPRGAGDRIVQILSPQQQTGLYSPQPFQGDGWGESEWWFRPCRISSSSASMFSPQQLFGSVGPLPFQGEGWGEGDRRFSSCRITPAPPPHYNQSRYSRNAARSALRLKPASAPGIIGNCQIMLPPSSSTTTRAEQQAKSRM